MAIEIYETFYWLPYGGYVSWKYLVKSLWKIFLKLWDIFFGKIRLPFILPVILMTEGGAGGRDVGLGFYLRKPALPSHSNKVNAPTQQCIETGNIVMVPSILLFILHQFLHREHREPSHSRYLHFSSLTAGPATASCLCSNQLIILTSTNLTPETLHFRP